MLAEHLAKQARGIFVALWRVPCPVHSHCQVAVELEQWQAADAKEDSRLTLLIDMSVEARVRNLSMVMMEHAGLKDWSDHDCVEQCRCCRAFLNGSCPGFRTDGGSSHVERGRVLYCHAEIVLPRRQPMRSHSCLHWARRKRPNVINLKCFDFLTSSAGRDRSQHIR